MLRNWAGNLAYRAAALHRPETTEQLRAVLAGARRIRVLGSRHAFNDIADADALVSLEALPRDIAVDPAAGTVSCSGAVRYGELAEALADSGLALHNLASLPHISVAGAVATATHGSGDGHGNLATAVAALELVTAEGELVSARRGDPEFDGLVVGLGALGAVTRVTLDARPGYEVRQRVFEGLAWDALAEHLDAIFAAGDSVSVFTRWADDVDQVWVKTRVGAAPEEPRADLFGARPATVERHPILGLDPVNCTAQLGRPGPWADRLPHFRMGFTPSAGDELQTEYLVPRRHAVAAIAALRELSGAIRPLLQVTELRTIAADELWMSPQHGEATLGIHFTWQPDQPAVERLLGPPRGGARPVLAASALGQAVRRRVGRAAPALPARRGLRGARGAARPARRAAQRLVRARHRLSSACSVRSASSAASPAPTWPASTCTANPSSAKLKRRATSTRSSGTAHARPRRVLQRVDEVAAPGLVHLASHGPERLVRGRAQPALHPQLPDRVVAVVGQVRDDVAPQPRLGIPDGAQRRGARAGQLQLGVAHRLDQDGVARGEVVEDVVRLHAGARGDLRELHVGDRVVRDDRERGLGDHQAARVGARAGRGPRRHVRARS